MRTALTALILATASLPALAGQSAYWGDGHWEYGAWKVSVTSTDEDGEIWTTCELATGDEVDPLLTVSGGILDGGGLHEPLSIMVTEYAMRNAPLALSDSQTIRFVVDNSAQFPATVWTGQTEDGPEYRVGHAVVDPQFTSAALAAMMRGDTIAAPLSASWTMRYALKGFTAALGKLAERCNFNVRDVAG